MNTFPPFPDELPSPGNNFHSSFPVRALGAQTLHPRPVSPETKAFVLQQIALAKFPRIVDIGCGDGTFLKEIAKNSGAKTIGLDLPVHRKSFRKRLTKSVFRPCFLDSAPSLFESLAPLKGKGRTLFLMNDVLGRITDPRPLLRRLRSLLKDHSDNRLVVSFPVKREETEALAQPFRRWTEKEFESFILSSGFSIEARQRGEETTIWSLSSSEETHSKFLALRGLPPSSPVLAITTETILHKNFGGIASYLFCLWDLLPQKPLIYATFPLPLEQKEGTGLRNWVFDRSFLFPREGVVDVSAGDSSLGVFEEIQQILFLYDSIEVIEIQDFIGDACRVAQAKRNGLLPPDVAVVCRGHGGHVYLERAGREWFDPSFEKTMLNEKVAVENADLFLPASGYLNALYKEVGIAPPSGTKPMALPHHVSACEPDDNPLDTVVFFGKPIEAKGFPDFMAAIRLLEGSEPFQKHVRKIVVLGGALSEPDREKLEALFPSVELSGRFLPRGEAVQFLRSLGSRALVLMPYRDDNWPMSVLETIDAGCQPLAYARGGIPEMFPKPFQEIALCRAFPKALAQGIEKILRMDRKKRVHKARELRKAWAKKQQETNAATVRFYKKISARVLGRKAPWRAENVALSVSLPVSDSTFPFLKDVMAGLNAQTFPPKEILLIDGGLEKTRRAQLRTLFKRSLPCPVRFVSVSKEGRAAESRNAALKACRTPFLVHLVSRDVPLPNFLMDIAFAFASDPEASVAMGLQRQFLDGDHWASLTSGVVLPLTGCAGLISQRENNLGHANAGFNVKKLKNLKDWESASFFEDNWDLYLRLTDSGGRVAVVPRVGSLKRTPESAATDAPPAFLTESRLAQATRPLWKSHRLQALSHLHFGHQTDQAASSLSALVASDFDPFLEAIRRARLGRLPPAVCPLDEKTDRVWKKRPALLLSLPDSVATAQEETLSIRFVLNQRPQKWIELLQHGNSPNFFRIRIFVGPTDGIRIEMGSSLPEKSAFLLAVPFPISLNVPVHVVVSLSAAVGCTSVWINGTRLAAKWGMAWEMPSSTKLWLGSRRLEAKIEDVRLYEGLLAEEDVKEMRE